MSETMQPPARGRNKKVFGCGKPFDWNTAQNVTEEEWTEFYGWVDFNVEKPSVFSGVRAAIGGLLNGLFGKTPKESPEERFERVTGELKATLSEEREALSQAARQPRS